MDEEKKYEFIYDDFKATHPTLASNVVSWYPSGQLEITLKMEDQSRYIYDLMLKGVRCVYRPGDEENKELTEEEWRDEFSRCLSKKIQTLGMTQKTLSELSGISQPSLTNYANGKSTPSSYTLHRLAKALRCSVAELTYFER